MKLQINYPETPKGKRSKKRNVYGNIVGYVSGKRFWEFGDDEKSAEFWIKGNSLERSYNECWLEEDK